MWRVKTHPTLSFSLACDPSVYPLPQTKLLISYKWIIVALHVQHMLVERLNFADVVFKC